MSTAIPDLSEPIWTAKLVAAVERAAAAISRLDARVCASSVAAPWQRRASWTGYTTALQAQGAEVDEIDIFSRECAVNLPLRRSLPTHLEDPNALSLWQRQLAQHRVRYWQEELAISAPLPEDWGERPALLRALEITARHVRADGTTAPWLALPALLRSMKITQATLPCLVVGDKALRLFSRDTQAIVVRNLRALAGHADEGLRRLQALEDDRLRSVVAIQAAHRLGKLLQLFALLQFVPVVSPRLVAQKLDITISGAGKLLTRAAELDLLVEVSGRQAWRTYLPRDLAITFGFVVRPAGRPLAPPRSLPEFQPTLAAFDRKMGDLDTMLAKLGVDGECQDSAPVWGIDR